MDISNLTVDQLAKLEGEIKTRKKELGKMKKKIPADIVQEYKRLYEGQTHTFKHTCEIEFQWEMPFCESNYNWMIKVNDVDVSFQELEAVFPELAERFMNAKAKDEEACEVLIDKISSLGNFENIIDMLGEMI